jgi:hypothetical protein
MSAMTAIAIIGSSDLDIFFILSLLVSSAIILSAVDWHAGATRRTLQAIKLQHPIISVQLFNAIGKPASPSVDMIARIPVSILERAASLTFTRK